MTKVNLGSYAPYVIHVCRFATATRNHPPARHFERQQPQHPLCMYHAECPPSMIKSDPVRTFELAPAAKRQQLPLDFVSYIVFRPQQQIVPAFPRRTQLPWHILHCPATSADKDHTCFSARIQQPSIRLCCLLAADSSPCFTHRVYTCGLQTSGYLLPATASPSVTRSHVVTLPCGPCLADVCIAFLRPAAE
jgi:hypothetical protein